MFMNAGLSANNHVIFYEERYQLSSCISKKLVVKHVFRRHALTCSILDNAELQPFLISLK